MATKLDPRELDMQEQLVRIRKHLADIDQARATSDKLYSDIKLATPQMFFQGGIAMAALIGAVVALVKLFP